MKKVISIVILLITVSSIGQTYKEVFEEVVAVDSTDRASLYERSLRWFVQNANNSNYVIKLKDPEKGEVYSKLSIETPKFEVRSKGNDWASAMNRMIVYKASIDISIQILSKDNRYKYVIKVDDVEKIEKLNNGNYAKNKKTLAIQDDKINGYIEPIVNSIIKEIKAHMSTKGNIEADDW